MTDHELARKWLWMCAVEFGCKELLKFAPKRDPHKYNWEEILRQRYEYVLDNWDEAVQGVKSGHTGQGSGYSKYCLGYSDQVRRSGIESTIRHKGISVTVTWAEIKAFIEEMLNPDNQLDMFDLLLQGAKHHD